MTSQRIRQRRLRLVLAASLALGAWGCQPAASAAPLSPGPPEFGCIGDIGPEA